MLGCLPVSTRRDVEGGYKNKLLLLNVTGVFVI